MDSKLTKKLEVDVYMEKFNHPLKKVVEALRCFILNVDKSIGEEVKWNAPTFFFTGSMKPSNPKEYKRYLIVSNVHYKDQIMLVLPHAAEVDDGSGFLEGDYKDGRRLLRFYSLEDFDKKKNQLETVVKKLLAKIVD